VYTHWPTREDLLRATIESLGQVKPASTSSPAILRDDLDILCGRSSRPQRRAAAPMIANMMERALHDPTVVTVRDEFFRVHRGVPHRDRLG
jgi:hypothetical protein